MHDDNIGKKKQQEIKMKKTSNASNMQEEDDNICTSHDTFHPTNYPYDILFTWPTGCELA